MDEHKTMNAIFKIFQTQSDFNKPPLKATNEQLVEFYNNEVIRIAQSKIISQQMADELKSLSFLVKNVKNKPIIFNTRNPKIHGILDLNHTLFLTGFTREHIQGISETKMDEWNKLCLKHFGLPLMVLNNTQIINALCEEWTDIVKYNNPVLAKSASGLIDLIRQADSPFDKTLQIHFNRSEQDEICLLYQFTDNLFLSYNFDSDFNKDTFENALIESDILLKQFFENAASYKKPTYPVLRLSSIKFMGKPPDKNIENETYSISRDIREHIRKLQLNVSANNKVALILKMAQELIKTHANEEQYFDLLESLSKMIRYVDAPVETSRMYISNDYKILLTDFDLEIKMQPLHKAVYILFYHHPEGILLANLDQHREELTNIYGAVSNRRDPELIEKTISELLNPASNAINECLSRIREAFLKVLDEKIASLYYISGERGGVKRIVTLKQTYENS